MYLIVYTSELSQPAEDIEATLKNIIEIAQVKNTEANITGLLFYHNSRFLQFIEGPKDELEKLMRTLSCDSRHKNIVRIVDEPVYVRSFSNWAMDSFNLNSDAVLSIEELRAVRDVYKKNVNVISNVLAMFYKQMLTHNALTQKRSLT
jgi:hypothetical protein